MDSVLFHNKRGINCRVCMLMITHECNLNCSYCYEAHKDNRSMSLDLAKNIIRNEIGYVKENERFDRLEIDFIGGEPFVNFPLIKKIVEWVETLNVGFPIGLFCSTNGTLVTPEKYEWLRRHRKIFACGLSYDGTMLMQETNRSGKYVDIPFFLETWPEQWFRITVSKETLPNVAEGVLHLQQRGANIQMCLAQGVSWDDGDAEILKRELKKLSLVYLSDNSLKPVDYLVKPLFNIARRGRFPVKLCGAGIAMNTYDVDGKCYPCHMFTPIVMGGKAMEIQYAKFCEDCESIDPKCKDCLFLNWCSNCYGFNYLYRDNPLIRDDSVCKMTNVHARSACEFQLNYFHKNRNSLSKTDNKQARAALDAYYLLEKHVSDWRFYQNDAEKGGEK